MFEFPLREPLLWVLHLGYGWLGVWFCLLGLEEVLQSLPPFASPPRSSALTGALRDHWARKIGSDHERHHCHGTRERLNSD
jgi:hypothetical protein